MPCHNYRSNVQPTFQKFSISIHLQLYYFRKRFDSLNLFDNDTKHECVILNSLILLIISNSAKTHYTKDIVHWFILFTVNYNIGSC